MSQPPLRSKGLSKYLHLGLLLIVVLNVVLLLGLFFHDKNLAVFNPKGYIAGEQSRLIVFSVALLLTIAVPTLILLYFTAWKYRETNQKATYAPQASHGKLFAFSIWAIPSLFMLVLALVMIPETHRLDPRHQINSTNAPITIQVVAMRWKWVFIYPEQHIASVNYVQIPTNTPIVFRLTADESPMSSFWIPNLAGQMYAMTGHVNTLHLMAREPGDYPGSSAELTGAGFAGMKFIARAGTTESFDQWVDSVKSSPDVLDSAEYKHLLTPSENNQTAFYSQAGPEVFSKTLQKYAGSHGASHTSSHGESQDVMANETHNHMENE
jgi:cytochrome o ubiquinol oxidase subunit 2